VEPAVVDAAPGAPVQFVRTGYFCADTRDSAPDRLVFSRTVRLRDTWGKIEKTGG
jgi:glutaminyl-tRNA synthetase